MTSSLSTAFNFTLPTALHVSVAGASSASAAPDDRLILRAQQVLKTVQEVGFACQEKIISCVEMYNPEGRTEAIDYARFGEERYFKYVDLSETIIAVRERYKAARESLGLKGIYVLQTAIVEGEHVGSCGELSCLAELHAKIAGLYAKVIVLEGEVRYVPGEAGNAGRDDHALVLVSDAPFDEAATPVAAEFVKTMKGLLNVVIIDLVVTHKC